MQQQKQEFDNKEAKEIDSHLEQIGVGNHEEGTKLIKAMEIQMNLEENKEEDSDSDISSDYDKGIL